MAQCHAASAAGSCQALHTWSPRRSKAGVFPMVAAAIGKTLGLPHGASRGAGMASPDGRLEDEVKVTEDKINALIKAAGVNAEPFWPGLFAKALANINIWSLICNVGAVGGTDPSTAAAPAEEKKVKTKKEESEKSDDDMAFGLFD
ncbi:hypothetical protein QTO34_000547 [Cnephaeus nilssonii]|uniref:Large ribosomal subunit protein P1 n=1 Tax=Cnephaeus nilssonii TaxID=3371016 RepID=A0AA40IBL9_CNENI|nr:hypothetical protein QTO34_000547 [Eptesicus nilssonii]